MHLLYIDDSGQIEDSSMNFCVLAGCSVYETKTHWIEQDMDNIAKKHFPNLDIEFHGSPMRSGKGIWRGIPEQTRIDAIIDVLNMISRSKSNIRIFASVVDKRSPSASGIDIAEHLFTQISSRFDMFLGRIYKKTHKPERGIVIFDKNKGEYRIQKMCRNFKTVGHMWGSLKNFSEVPLFLDSQASRLIQLADIISYSIFRFYEAQDTRFYPIIQNNIDREGNVVHGLHILS